MGAWGQGPFDSDGALDYIDGLSAALDLDLAEDPSEDETSLTLDAQQTALLVAEVQATLVDAPAASAWQLSEVYAAAGLVAAALAGTRAVAGTRLFSAFAKEANMDAGLERHMGLADLIPVEQATQLTP